MREIRICENCNHHNNITLLECEECGFDLSMIIPSIEENAPEILANEFESVQCNIRFRWAIAPVDSPAEIFPVQEKMAIGRVESPIADLLNRSSYVSRNHAQLLVIDDQLCVIDASTNGTYVNNNRIHKMDAVVLRPDDIVKFANISFRVVKQNAD